MDIKILASGSSGNAYHISDGKTSLLLDAGISIKRIQIGIGFRLSQVSAALISHEHNDHCKAVPDLIRAGVDIYAPDEVYAAKQVTGPRCRSAEPMRKIQIGSFTVMPFDCQHDVTNYGYLIKSHVTGEQLLYFTDTYYVKYTFPGCDYIMAECNYSIEAINGSIAAGYLPVELKKRLVQSHMSIDNLLDMLKANDLSKIKQIYLLHLSDNNSREEEFKESVQRLVGCEVYVC